MITRLRQPGGFIGGVSVTAFFFLGFFGILGCVLLLVSLATGGEFWSDSASDKVIGAVFFAVTVLGAVGFVIMDREPTLGAFLAVLGSISFFVILWWALLPLILGPLFAVVAIFRARALRGGVQAQGA